MPKIQVTGKQSEGWQPLPSGSCDFMIDKVEEGTSKAGNPQLKVSVHVMDGPHADKKATIWYSLLEQAVWKIAGLLEATGVGEVVELMDQIDPDTGKPKISVDFDSDDLVGMAFCCDVSQGTTPDGKAKNDFVNEREPASGAKAKTAAAPTGQAAPAAQQQAVAAPAANGGAAAGAAAAPVRRRRTA